MYGQQLKPQQFQALDGLRRALSAGPAGSMAGVDLQLQDAAANMDEVQPARESQYGAEWGNLLPQREHDDTRGNGAFVWGRAGLALRA
jgi:hypothetical protein